MTIFKVAIIKQDNYEVSYYRSIIDGCYFTSTDEVTGAASYVTFPGDSGKYYVAETIDDLVSSSNGEPALSSKNYYALISQTGTNDPVVNLLNDNDRDYLGEVLWTRTGVGNYKGTLTGQLPAYCTFMPSVYKNDGTIATVDAVSGLPNFVTINTTVDDKLTKSPIEIKVFLNVTLP